MKKQLILMIVLIVSTLQLVQAQTELKISPAALLAGAGAVGLEYGITEDFGVEVEAWAAPGGGALFVLGKYYLNPRKGLDRFHVGVLAGGITDLGAGFGFMAGSKIVSRKNITFEFGLGLGRSFSQGIFPYGKFHVGYRFRS